MPYYTSNLITKIIEEPAKFCDELVILSGYGSPFFLEDIIKIIPHHRVKLILGMTPQGISKEKFDDFKNIAINNEKVEILFQIEEPPTHMKIYQWYNKRKPKYSYQGSANFSYAGFVSQNEILSLSDKDFDKIIADVLPLCCNCLDENIKDFIKVYEEDYKEPENVKETPEEYGSEELRHKPEAKDFRPKRFKWRTTEPLTNSVHINLILPNDKSSLTKGINIWERDGKSEEDAYIDLSRHYGELDKFFPKDKPVDLETDDGLNLTVKRRGPHGRELIILNEETNFYNYFLRRLELDTHRPISYADLESYGRTDIEITKIGNNRFKLNF